MVWDDIKRMCTRKSVKGTYEHQEAARRVFSNHSIELYLTYDDDGNLIAVTVSKF